MNYIFNILREKPLIGSVLTLAPTLLRFITEITPYIQFAATVVGLAIGVITLAGQVLKIAKKTTCE